VERLAAYLGGGFAGDGGAEGYGAERRIGWRWRRAGVGTRREIEAPQGIVAAEWSEQTAAQRGEAETARGGVGNFVFL
jgi:hypothetical protein